MFMTMLDHDGRTWTVRLRVIPAEGERGWLEFHFSHPGQAGEPNELTWRISGNSLEALAHDREDVSEEILRGQLIRAIAEANTVDAAGAG